MQQVLVAPGKAMRGAGLPIAAIACLVLWTLAVGAGSTSPNQLGARAAKCQTFNAAEAPQPWGGTHAAPVEPGPTHKESTMRFIVTLALVLAAMAGAATPLVIGPLNCAGLDGTNRVAGRFT